MGKNGAYTIRLTPHSLCSILHTEEIYERCEYMIPYIQPVLYLDPQASEPRGCDRCCGECRASCALGPDREDKL